MQISLVSARDKSECVITMTNKQKATETRKANARMHKADAALISSRFPGFDRKGRPVSMSVPGSAATPGFGCKIEETTQLGIATLVAEYEGVSGTNP